MIKLLCYERGGNILRYQNYNRFCTLTAIANLLEDEGIIKEDYELLKESNLIYMFDKIDNQFITGPMLQTKEWLNMILNKHDYSFKENILCKAQVFDYLKSQKQRCIIGLLQNNNKHAVIFEEYNNNYRFTNIVYKNNLNNVDLTFTEEELLSKLGNEVHIGKIVKEKRNISFNHNKYQRSQEVLFELQESIEDIKGKTYSYEELLVLKKNLFECLFLDIPSALQVLDETKLFNDIIIERNKFILIKPSHRIVLEDCINLDILIEVLPFIAKKHENINRISS